LNEIFELVAASGVSIRADNTNGDLVIIVSKGQYHVPLFIHEGITPEQFRVCYLKPAILSIEREPK